MSFTSAAFLIFLPVVFALYWLTRRSVRLQNSVLLAASYVFYGWWDWRFLILIMITSLSSFASGLLIVGSAESKRRDRLTVAANIVLNIGILAVFKYYNFFAGSLNDILGGFGVSFSAPTLKLLLPIGISFYTFQSMGYIVDVYREKTAAQDSVQTVF